MKMKARSRNWLLVSIASIIIILDLLIITGVVLYSIPLGWWSFIIVAGALSSLSLSVMAIKTNDPAWLLLDIIIPS
ncbi:MAG TPA: hypothetical protein VF575_01095 [Candidatus Saccharimonadales bacterium]|jgi:hypothetical protein